METNGIWLTETAIYADINVLSQWTGFEKSLTRNRCGATMRRRGWQRTFFYAEKFEGMSGYLHGSGHEFASRGVHTFNVDNKRGLGVETKDRQAAHRTLQWTTAALFEKTTRLMTLVYQILKV